MTECHRIIVKGLADLKWLSRFIDETPGDQIEGGSPRQVKSACWSKVKPSIVPNPEIMIWSNEMASDLHIDKKEVQFLVGNKICAGMKPYSQCYGGHQFGTWARQLGDGRAITLGEIETDEKVMEIQLKGAGITPFSRMADGKAVLRSSIREFLCSEAMHHLGVPTTRALSLSTTGEKILRDIFYNGNPVFEQGAIVCRIAPSFLRFGTFQIHAYRNDKATLKSLVKHTLKNHYTHLNSTSEQKLLLWMKEVAEMTARMVVHWMRVGFVHGVMNTDNMSIHGLTIDYGPYGWIEDFNLEWTPNTTDHIERRYRFGNQPSIAKWNLARFVESISLIMEDTDNLSDILDHYDTIYFEQSKKMWCQKLGIKTFNQDLINKLLQLLTISETDMTIFFRLLATLSVPKVNKIENCFYDFTKIPKEEWNQWLATYLSLASHNRMNEMNLVNPKYVLRNWMAQLAIEKAELGDFSLVKDLHELLKKPYNEQSSELAKKWFVKRPEWAKHKPGSSMLSCSS